MTTGEGGMITTNNEELYKIANSIRNHGRNTNTLGTYEYERFGLNCRLTDISSAIGRVQLRKLKYFNEKRTRNAEMYNDLFKDNDSIITPKCPNNYTHSWHQYTIRVQKRDFVQEKLKNLGIGTGIYYPKPVYDYPHLQKFKNECPNSETASLEVLSLPVHPDISQGEISYISESLINILDSY